MLRPDSIFFNFAIVHFAIFSNFSITTQKIKEKASGNTDYILIDEKIYLENLPLSQLMVYLLPISFPALLSNFHYLTIAHNASSTLMSMADSKRTQPSFTAKETFPSPTVIIFICFVLNALHAKLLRQI